MIRLRIVCSSSKMAFAFILVTAIAIFGVYWTAKYMMLPSEVTNTTTTSTTSSSNVFSELTSPVTLDPTLDISDSTDVPPKDSAAKALDVVAKDTATNEIAGASPVPNRFYDYLAS